jgi:hypothetical protein
VSSWCVGIRTLGAVRKSAAFDSATIAEDVMSKITALSQGAAGAKGTAYRHMIGMKAFFPRRQPK